MGGFVLVHRDLIGNPKFRGKDDEYAAIWLVVHAAWRLKTVRIARHSVKLRRGQCAYAQSYLAKAWEVSKSTAGRILKHLEKTGFLETQDGTGCTLITICNYDKYQINTEQGETQPDTRGGTTLGRSWDAGGTNNNEGNESNEGNEEEGESPCVSITTPEGQPELSQVGDGTGAPCAQGDGGTRSSGDHPPSAISDQSDLLNPDVAINPVAKGDTVSPLMAAAQSPVEVAIRMWNAMADRTGRPRVQKTTKKRRAMLQRRLKDAGGLEGWEMAMEKVASSPFLTGKSSSDWKGATLDWVINEDNFTKLMEGNYDPGPKRFPGDNDPSGVMAALERLGETR